MYKLVIVDDEVIIRESLQKYIQWNRLGFEVVNVFEDGRDVIGFLQENDVDVILTDIKMAQISGLEVARYVSRHKPDVKVVMAL